MHLVFRLAQPHRQTPRTVSGPSHTGLQLQERVLGGTGFCVLPCPALLTGLRPSLLRGHMGGSGTARPDMRGEEEEPVEEDSSSPQPHIHTHDALK